MKKNTAQSLSLRWILVALFTCNAPIFVHAAEPTRQISIEKQNLLQRLVNEYKETRDLYRKRKAGKASYADLKKLRGRMRKIKKTARTAGLIAAFIAAVLGGFAYKRSQTKRKVKSAEPKQEQLLITWAEKHTEEPAINPEDAKQQALMDAIKKGSLGAVKTALDEGAQPDRAYEGTTPLIMATKGNNRNIVHLLLNEDADPNISKSGNTPLSVAAENDYIGIASELLEHGAQPNYLLGKPLEKAVQEGNTLMIKLLLRHGADPSYLTQPFVFSPWIPQSKRNRITQILENALRE